MQYDVSTATGCRLRPHSIVLDDKGERLPPKDVGHNEEQLNWLTQFCLAARLTDRATGRFLPPAALDALVSDNMEVLLGFLEYFIAADG